MTQEKILTHLDDCSLDFNFPMLDNGYVYPAGTRLTAYCDDKRWAMVIETIGFSYRGGGHNGISNSMYIYGNCLDFEPGLQNENFIWLTADAGDIPTFDDEEYFYLNPECERFLLRDNELPVCHDRTVYQSHGIEPEDPDRINAFEFLRLLDALYHDQLVATEGEIRKRIPEELPLIIKLDEWYHPDVANQELPSENETFIQLGDVLISGDISCYKPTKQPNTHWENWPEGGTM